MKKLTLVIPAKNESESLPNVLSELRKLSLNTIVVLEKEDLIKRLHTLPNHPNWIPYRTSYYKRDWGFCCRHSLLESEKFEGPFEVNIDSSFILSNKSHFIKL